MLVCLDVESTGADHFHGCRPFLVTIYKEGSIQPTYYEWFVDPHTRQPIDVEEDLLEIVDVIDDESNILVGQNIKFDVQSLTALYDDYGIGFNWPWHRTYDTLIAGHLLATNQRHDLTSMAIQYLGEDISKYEVAVKAACTKARYIVKRDLQDWVIAVKGGETTPSAKGQVWALDMWLPRAIAKEYSYAESHTWWSVVSDYANVDSTTTLYLWIAMEKKIKERGLWKIFQERMKLLPIAVEMEARGVTLSVTRLEGLIKEYEEESTNLATICCNIADDYGYPLNLPKAGNNQSLRTFCFGGDILLCKQCDYQHYLTRNQRDALLSDDSEELPYCPECLGDGDEEVKFTSEGGIVQGQGTRLVLSRHDYLNLPAIKRSAKTGEPSLDKGALETFEATLPRNSKPYVFVKSLREKRRRDTAVQYLKGYKRYWLPIESDDRDIDDEWYMLHPGTNPTGTDTLRWSFTNPNEANISKTEGFNLRYCFGPEPGREWYSLDGQNLELRIPAYEANETDLIYVFDHPDEPPYYGSYHLFVFDILHPELFKKHGKKCKQLFESTWYQWTKNGNFAIIYGAQEAKADLTYRVPGAFQKIRYRFPKIAKLSDKQLTLGRKYGYVQTIPDKEVDPDHGYPILCARSEFGQVMPTTTLNYHISGTAMQWTNRAMVKTHAQLKEWQRRGFDGYITMQVHDELVFSLPRHGDPLKDLEKEKTSNTYFRTSNLWRVRVLQRLMESCGNAINVPTPVSVEFHNSSWDVGLQL